MCIELVIDSVILRTMMNTVSACYYENNYYYTLTNIGITTTVNESKLKNNRMYNILVAYISCQQIEDGLQRCYEHQKPTTRSPRNHQPYINIYTYNKHKIKCVHKKHPNMSFDYSTFLSLPSSLIYQKTSWRTKSIQYLWGSQKRQISSLLSQLILYM